MKTLIRFIFELKGDFDPGLLPEMLLLSCHETSRKGEAVNPKRAKQYDYWYLDSR